MHCLKWGVGTVKCTKDNEEKTGCVTNNPVIFQTIVKKEKEKR